MRGLLITLEGIDGSGKTTVSKILAHKLAQALPNERFVFTAEPTEGEAGKILKKVRLVQSTAIQNKEISKARKMEELFLFISDHCDHLARMVIPSLENGAIVISDRYTDSTAAYQGVTLRSIVSDPVEWIRDLIHPWNIAPARTILFVVDPAQAIERLGSRANTEKFERLEFLKEVDRNFRRIAAREPERFDIIDANKMIDEVAEHALKTIIDVIRENH